VIERHKNRHVAVGLYHQKQLIVYDLVEKLTEEAAPFSIEIFECLDIWLDKKAILVQSDAQKEMRNSIKPVLAKHGIERNLSKVIVSKLVEAYV
jgi:hypothetical protein